MWIHRSRTDFTGATENNTAQSLQCSNYNTQQMTQVSVMRCDLLYDEKIEFEFDNVRTSNVRIRF